MRHPCSCKAKIQTLEDEKRLLAEAIKRGVQPMHTFVDTRRTALTFLSNPWKFWVSERLDDKRMVLKLTCADRLSHHRDGGLRTPEVTLPFQCIQALKRPDKAILMPKNSMARPGGQTSNSLFEVLAEWDRQLQEVDRDLLEPLE